MQWTEGTCRREFQQEGLDGLGVQQQLLASCLPNLAAPVPRHHNLGLLMAIQAPVTMPDSIALLLLSVQERTLVRQLALHCIWAFAVAIASKR